MNEAAADWFGGRFEGALAVIPHSQMTAHFERDKT
jgi:hypothetical protein